MRKLYFTDEPATSAEVAILIKPTGLVKEDLERYYVDSLEAKGIGRDKVIAYELYYSFGKVKAVDAKAYIKELIEEMKNDGIQYVYCADAAYFKYLSKQKKAQQNLGYVFDIPDTDMQIILGVNYGSVIYDPTNLHKLTLSLSTLKDIYNQDFIEIGHSIISKSYYPDTVTDISNILRELLDYPVLYCDIETYSLKFHEAGISTIGFSVDKNQGTAFAVDYATNHEPNIEVRSILKEFFTNYTGTLVFHNANYDVKVLVYELFMEHLSDWQGMFKGFEVFNKIEDTRIIAYLALNSTTKPSLSLKELAHEFAGNYAQDDEDIKDVRRISLEDLLKYNLIDCLATSYVYETHFPTLKEDDLEGLYYGLMIDSMYLILQVELSGMPLDPKRVQTVKKIFEAEVDKAYGVFNNFREIEETVHIVRQQALDKKNASLKKKQHTIDMPNYQNIVFNPNSNPQLQILLYEVMGLPVINLTQTKQPSADGDTLQTLLNHVSEAQKPILQALIDYNDVKGMLANFIPNFEQALDKGGSVHYLHGSFNIGGVLSGRLSASRPNLQQIPSSSRYAKLIKECFTAEEGEIFCGADFSSLEDRINTLLTKDTNKLAVYTGHEVYSLTIDGVEHTIRDDDKISYNDSIYTGKQFYELFKGENQ